MSYKPGDTVWEEFVTSGATGAAVNADALPAVTLVRNGTDTAEAMTVANVDTGRYKVTGTVPGGWAAGDKLHLAVSATIGAVAAKAILSLGVLDSKRVGDLEDLTAAELDARTLPAADYATAAALTDRTLPAAEYATADLLDERTFTILTNQTTLLDERLTAGRAGHLDNLNVGGPVASAADLDAVAEVAVKLDGTLEADGPLWRFTADALEQAPAGGGGGAADWTADERSQIRAALGVAGATLDTTGTGNLDRVKTKTDLLGSGTVVVRQPVLRGGKVRINRTDDYAETESRMLSWQEEEAGDWPDLTGADVDFYVAGVLFQQGEVVEPTDFPKTVQVELTRTQAASKRRGTYAYRVQATLANGNIVTLAKAGITFED